jgi:hypothetical protein
MATPVMLFVASNISAFETINSQPFAVEQQVSSNVWTKRKIYFGEPSAAFARFRGEDKNPLVVVPGHTLCLRVQQHNTTWTGDNQHPLMQVWDSFGVPALAVFGLQQNGVSGFQLAYNANAMSNSSAATAWTFLPNWNAFTQNVNDQNTSSLQLNITFNSGGNHTIELVQDDARSLGIQSFSFTTMTSGAGFAGFGVVNNDFGGWSLSQFMARMDGDLTGSYVYDFQPNYGAESTHHDWSSTGGVGGVGVSEIPDDPTTFVSADTVGEAQTYVMPVPTQLGGFQIDSIWQYLTARDAATPARPLTSLFTMSGFDFPSSTVMGGTMQASFSTLFERWDQYPMGGAWNASEFGIPTELGWKL